MTRRNRKVGLQQWLGACLWLPRNHSLEKGSTPFFSLLVNQGVLEFFFQLFVVRFSVPSFTYVHWKNLTRAHCVVVPPHKNGIFSDLVPDLAEHLSVGLKLARQE